MGTRYTNELVAEVIASASKSGYLEILGKWVLELTIARDYFALDLCEVEQSLAGELVHPLHEVAQLPLFARR